MKTIVVYESFWGNTAAVARAVAEGYGPESKALSTAEAAGEALSGIQLIVAGAPVIGFRLSTEEARRSMSRDPRYSEKPPDLSSPALRSWLSALPSGAGYFAAFDTRFRWSPGSATGAIARALEQAGYRRLDRDQRFLVKGVYGPLADGELERAMAWGTKLAQLSASVRTPAAAGL